MDQKQLQADIAAKKLLVSACKENFRQAEFDLALLETEAGKPELRHGDYGYDNRGNVRLVVKKAFDAAEIIHGNDNYLYEGLPSCDITNRLGNIFDDLAALQEDLTSFKIKSPTEVGRYLMVSLDKSPRKIATLDLYTQHGHKDCMNLSEKSLKELILNLQRIRATLLRSKAK